MRFVFLISAFFFATACLCSAEERLTLYMKLHGNKEQIKRNDYLAEWVGQLLEEQHAITVKFTAREHPSKATLAFGHRNDLLAEFPISQLESPSGIEQIVQDVSNSYESFSAKVHARVRAKEAEAATLAKLKEAKEPVLDPEFYRQYSGGAERFRGGLFPDEGWLGWVSRDRSRKIIRRMMLKRLKALNIPQNQLTVSILTGVFTPDPTDLKLAFESLDANEAKRIQTWNRIYGTLDPNGRYKSFVNGQKRYLRPDEIMLINQIGIFNYLSASWTDYGLIRTMN